MQETTTIEITEATTAEQLDQVRALIRAFLKWHLKRHLEDTDLIKEYFNEAAFEEELASLPGKYAKPGGSLLLATVDAEPAGCVALRRIDARTCEMKRMFVYDQFKGKKIGLALAKAIIAEARDMGYVYMKLDTSFRQVEAISLYEGLGFKKTGAYYPVSKKQRAWLVFMELRL